MVHRPNSSFEVNNGKFCLMKRCGRLANEAGRYDGHVAGGSSKVHIGTAEKHEQQNGKQHKHVEEKVHQELQQVAFDGQHRLVAHGQLQQRQVLQVDDQKEQRQNVNGRLSGGGVLAQPPRTAAVRVDDLHVLVGRQTGLAVATAVELNVADQTVQVRRSHTAAVVAERQLVRPVGLSAEQAGLDQLC